MLSEIENLPEVSFIDNTTLDDIQKRMVGDYEERYKQITGGTVALKRADPVTLILYACSVQIYQALLFVDRAGKQDLLKYSYGEYLDNLAAYKGVTRNPATEAEVTLRFTLSAVQTTAIGIPAGTRVTNGSDIYFATNEYAEIPVGETHVDVNSTCLTAGISGNDLLAGDIDILVDVLPYIAKAENIETSRGGADEESDESLAERVFLAPASYSTAGPTDAYKQHAKSYSSSIGDVNVFSPKPCEVEVRVLLTDGTLPSEALLDGIYDHLNDMTIRPLTDHIRVLRPETVTYNISMTYYIAKSNRSKAVAIQNAVAEAIEDFNRWQTRTIGRDINPSELTKRVVAAGAKRCEIELPKYEIVSNTSVARTGNISVTYGGVEDD